MIASFRDLAAVMTRCVSIIEDYARLSPSALGTTATSYPIIPNLSASELTALAQAMPPSLAEAPMATGAAPDAKKERKKREKKPKDPNAPKRPPSAYILFQNEVRDALRSSQPQLSYREVLDHIAERWKHLTDAQKKVGPRTSERLWFLDIVADVTGVPGQVQCCDRGVQDGRAKLQPAWRCCTCE